MNVIVTGATKGIGRAIAERYALDGHTIIACARTEKDLAEMKEHFTTQYPSAIVHTRAVDMSNEDEIKAFGKWILSSNWVPDILINNAGSFLPGSIHNEEEGTLQKMIEVNLYSAYFLTRALLPSMMDRKKGHIFNMCSIASLKAYDNGGSYSISKFALLGFSKNLREELKPYNIKVTAVCPGAVMTDSWAGSGIAPDRIMESSDIAEMIYSASKLSPMAVVEDIVMRPQLGDL